MPYGWTFGGLRSHAERVQEDSREVAASIGLVLCFRHFGAEPEPDLVRLGRAELGVQRECLLPVVTSSLVLAGAAVAFGELAVRACLLVGVAGFGRPLERCRQLGAGGGGLAGRCRASARMRSAAISPCWQPACRYKARACRR